MKNKILCFLLIATFVCSIFVISASADDNTYDFNLISPPYLSNDIVDADVFISNFSSLFNSMTIGEAIYFDTDDDVISRVYLLRSDETNLNVGFTVVEPELSPDPLDIVAIGFDFSEGFVYDGFLSLDELNIDIHCFVPDTYAELLKAFFPSSTYSSVTDFPVLSSGYYRLILPIDVSDPSWIGDGNIVWYDMRGRVVTDTSNRAFSFYRLGFRYNELLNDDGSYGGFSLELLINDYNHDEYDELLPYLEIYSITYFADEDRYYYGFNDLVLESFVGIALDGDYEVNADLKVLFDDIFEPYDYVYTGNPWFDIIDGVVDALKIDVFGSFSPWDILVTFIGISVFIWLLKLLAGG